jgi:hypothetical protein
MGRSSPDLLGIVGVGAVAGHRQRTKESRVTGNTDSFSESTTTCVYMYRYKNADKHVGRS